MGHLSYVVIVVMGGIVVMGHSSYRGIVVMGHSSYGVIVVMGA